MHELIFFETMSGPLKSDLVSGTVIVGVRPELPVNDVSMLLGNDSIDTYEPWCSSLCSY